LDSGADRRQAVAAVAVELRLPKRQVYEVALGLAATERPGRTGDQG
jgi:hypothetical protein